ncbi:MAG: MFS transporter, partial [Terriglobia bacterium]
MGHRTQLVYVSWLAGTASLGGFLFGYDSAVINGAVSGIQRGFHSTNAATGFEVASILLGCALGALAAGRLADHLGRRLT